MPGKSTIKLDIYPRKDQIDLAKKEKEIREVKKDIS